MKKIISKLKNIKFRDIFGMLKFVLVLIPALVYRGIIRIRKKEIWLICETELTARDNGWVFFNYIKKHHPEIKSYYAIDKNCNDYKKMKEYTEIINWSSFKHYFIYLSATRNISSHKEGNPNHTLFTVIHVYLNMFNKNRVFLQHGVLYQNFEMFHKKNSNFGLFITGAKPEYEFVKQKYGYTNEVVYTGLARFDNLINVKADPDIILYMPTWRRWISSEKVLKDSLYYKGIESFLNNKSLNDILDKYKKELHFVCHGGLRKFEKEFNSSNSRVKVYDISLIDVQKKLIECSALITDFSSVHTDVAFMKKPIIYYQYDEADYKELHVGKSAHDTYYDYKKDGFGVVVGTEEELVKSITKIITTDYKVEEIYIKRINDFFELHDKKNCERIFEEIKKMRGNEK